MTGASPYPSEQETVVKKHTSASLARRVQCPQAQPAKFPSSRQRRQVLGVLAGSLVLGPLPLVGMTAQAAVAAGGNDTARLALLIGNRAYPDGDDLPPVHKNVRDLKAALERRGFAVTDALDIDLPSARTVVANFSRQLRDAPPDATVFFYYSGHGAQVEAENLLISAHLSPKARPGTLLRGSMNLTGDVVALLARRPLGLTMAVIDACRTSLIATQDNDGLNQVEAPPGCLIAFATGAGKPAIAPVDENRNTFYTASLVKLLNSASDEITYSDLFRLVKTDVQQTMLNHPVPLLRQMAQVPFIAENAQVPRRIAPLKKPPAEQVEPPAAGASDASPTPQGPTAGEVEAWERIEASVWPAEVARHAGDYLRDFPQSALAPRAQVAREGAGEAARILARQDVRLYRNAFQSSADMQPEQVGDIAKAGRGDKDAAARLGRWYLRKPESQRSRTDSGRYEGWMQFAAALGNGIASYELALHYRRADQPHLAALFEARARELGYTPPPSLDNTRK
ncbi:MAG: hypothetical protein RIQ60_1360 [Pseudomonadota bacterium]